MPAKNVTMKKKINSVQFVHLKLHFAVVACQSCGLNTKRPFWGLFRDRFSADCSTTPFKCDVWHTEVVNLPAVAVPKTETTEQFSVTLLLMMPVSLSSRQTKAHHSPRINQPQQDGACTSYKILVHQAAARVSSVLTLTVSLTTVTC